MARVTREDMDRAERQRSPEAMLADFVHNLEDDFLRCRARAGRHREPDPLDPERNHFKRLPGGTYQQDFVCEDCGRTIVRLIAASGYLDDKVSHDRAGYQPGYLLPKGILGEGSPVTKKQVNAMMRREARLRNMRRARKPGTTIVFRDGNGAENGGNGAEA